MDIPHIIKDMLTRREGLVIPGLGSLTSAFQPASIRPDQKLIQPPRKKLRLDTKVQTDADEVLASELATRQNISLEKAREQIQKYVDEIHNQLNTKGRYEIEGIGVLEKKLAGTIQLKEAATAESDLGFEALTAEPFELEPPPSPPPPVGKRSRKKRTIWFSLLAVFLLLVGYAGWYTGFYDYVIRKWEQKQQTAQMPPQKKEGNRKETPEKKNAGQKAADTTGQDSQVDQVLDRMTDKKQALMYKEQKDTTDYYIVAGSFRKMKNAQEYCRQLKQKGYTTRILEKNGLYRITVQSFDKKEDALVKLYQMRDTGKLESIWLLAAPEKDR
ncbi:MAG: SPOR domain-containing protein [Bacteroidales bacterium]|nr:SPOR domain-containing protein [Bacteroidales bacterium]